MRNKGLLGSIVIGAVILFGVVTYFSCTVRVPAGYTGIVYNYRSGASGETVSQGYRFVGPFKEVVLYSIGIEQSYLTSTKEGDSPNDDSFETSSSDGKALKVDLTFTYRFDESKIAEIFNKFKGQDGKTVRDSFIKPNIISWTKEVTAQYSVIDILGEKRAVLNSTIADYLKEKFKPYGIIIENASLINIDADEETRAQVQKKVNAIQELELAQTEKKTAQVRADQEKDVALTKAQQEKEAATIKAEQAKIEAEAEAEVIKTKAAAEAEANRLIAESLTPELIEMTKYQQWNGKLPQITTSEGLIVDARDFEK